MTLCDKTREIVRHQLWDTMSANLKSMFDLLDWQQNGVLNIAEFRVGLASVGLDLSTDEAISLFQSIDINHREQIDKQSFGNWVDKEEMNSNEMRALRQRLQVALVRFSAPTDPYTLF